MSESEALRKGGYNLVRYDDGKEGVADALKRHGKYVVTYEKGIETGMERIRDNQHLLSLPEYLDLAREAGYSIDVNKGRLQ